MREILTDLLDLLGLLLVAIGVTAGVWSILGPWALSVGGCVVLAGSWFAAGGRAYPVRWIKAKLRRKANQ